MSKTPDRYENAIHRIDPPQTVFPLLRHEITWRDTISQIEASSATLIDWYNLDFFSQEAIARSRNRDYSHPSFQAGVALLREFYQTNLEPLLIQLRCEGHNHDIIEIEFDRHFFGHMTDFSAKFILIEWMSQDNKK